jgi:CheY-like chemotaxis protein
VAKILIVDDDQDTRQLLKIRLEANGYETAFAWDAVTAISVTREERPDLILLDFGLPGGDALVVMERLRSFPALASTPIVVVSAREPSGTEQRALAGGALAYVPKPIDNEQLLGAIRTALNQG